MGAVEAWYGRLGGMNVGSVLTAVIDIAVVAFVIYKLMMLVKGTRAWQIMWGLGVFSLLFLVSKTLHLRGKSVV